MSHASDQIHSTPAGNAPGSNQTDNTQAGGLPTSSSPLAGSSPGVDKENLAPPPSAYAIRKQAAAGQLKRQLDDDAIFTRGPKKQ